MVQLPEPPVRSELLEMAAVPEELMMDAHQRAALSHLGIGRCRIIPLLQTPM